jgi:hypothetical protein
MVGSLVKCFPGGYQNIVDEVICRDFTNRNGAFQLKNLQFALRVVTDRFEQGLKQYEECWSSAIRKVRLEKRRCSTLVTSLSLSSAPKVFVSNLCFVTLNLPYQLFDSFVNDAVLLGTASIGYERSGR